VAMAGCVVDGCYLLIICAYYAGVLQSQACQIDLPSCLLQDLKHLSSS